MPCPLFEDFTRMCVDRFRKIQPEVTFDFCSSEEYKICPFYKIIIEKYSYCEFIEDCASKFLKLIGFISKNPRTYSRVMQLVYDYCLSENNKMNCARRKLMTSGEKIPKNLLQDGNKLKLREIIF